jgi:predicted Zn-dependent protease
MIRKWLTRTRSALAVPRQGLRDETARRRATVSAQLRQVLASAVACSFVFTTFVPAPAHSRGLVLIRDSEIEALMRDYATPVFSAAGLVAADVRVHLIADDSINAFVAGGQRIFVHTGLLLQAETPNEVIGVLAHETGHIAGGHLARLRRQIDRASTAAIIGMLLGAVAVAGGVATGSPGAAQAGQSVLLGGSDLARKTVLSYQRAQEASADQAAVGFLDQSGMSASGMLRLFEKLANQSLVSLQNADPYVFSHPMPRERISFLQRLAEQSPFFGKEDAADLVFRHTMMQAKLHGYLLDPRDTLRRYPTSDTSMQARYARSIAFYRSGELANAMENIDALLAASPNNPYFWEVKGQALFETGNVERSIEPLSRAAELAPNAPQIRILLAQAMIGTEKDGYLNGAVEHLRTAFRLEGGSVSLHRQLALAYGRKGDIGMAELESAEASVLAGDLELAKQFAERARTKLSQGTPQYVRAQDILRLNPADDN